MNSLFFIFYIILFCHNSNLLVPLKYILSEQGITRWVYHYSWRYKRNCTKINNPRMWFPFFYFCGQRGKQACLHGYLTTIAKEEKRIYQQCQDPDHPSALPSCPISKGTIPEADGARLHPQSCIHFQNLSVPEKGKSGVEGRTVRILVEKHVCLYPCRHLL